MDIKNDINEIILNEIEFEGRTFYVDKYNGIWDMKSNLVGLINEGVYIFFTDTIHI